MYLFHTTPNIGRYWLVDVTTTNSRYRLNFCRRIQSQFIYERLHTQLKSNLAKCANELSFVRLLFCIFVCCHDLNFIKIFFFVFYFYYIILFICVSKSCCVKNAYICETIQFIFCVCVFEFPSTHRKNIQKI